MHQKQTYLQTSNLLTNYILPASTWLESIEYHVQVVFCQPNPYRFWIESLVADTMSGSRARARVVSGQFPARTWTKCKMISSTIITPQENSVYGSEIDSTDVSAGGF